MITIKTQITVVIVLGALSLVSGYFAHLALTDIYHGEADVTLEWRVVQTSALIILLFIGSSLFTLYKSRKLVSE